MTLEMILDDDLSKIIEFLLENPVLDYSKDDLVKQVGVSRNDLFSKWDQLENNSIVKKIGKRDDTQLYRLDTDSDIVNILGRLKRSEFSSEEDFAESYDLTEEEVVEAIEGFRDLKPEFKKKIEEGLEDSKKGPS